MKLYGGLASPYVARVVLFARLKGIALAPQLPAQGLAHPGHGLAVEHAVGPGKVDVLEDAGRCVGCHACTITCVAENKPPPGVVYRPVMEEEIGSYPAVRRRFVPRPCLHCQNPPCVKVCPVTTTYKDENGVVVVNYDRCIGCRYCLVACPYSARTSDFGEWYTAETADGIGAMYGRDAAAESYERIPAAEYGKSWPKRGRRSPVGNARKCHFCKHRLAVGMLPAW